MASTTTHFVEKITARVFCQKQGTGGNPVTIFSCLGHRRRQCRTAPSAASGPVLALETQQRLARSCAWESVVLQQHDPKAGSPPSMAFYMPTGEPVSFCAHAAMGGASQLMQVAEVFDSTTISDRDNENADRTEISQETSRWVSFTADMPPHPTYSAQITTDQDHDGVVVALDMVTPFEEARIHHPPMLQRILRETFRLQAPDLVTPPPLLRLDQTPSDGIGNLRYPTFCNTSVARPKTLVYVSSMQTLQQLTAPTASEAFRRACDALDTTGLYLYTPHAPEDDAARDPTSLEPTIECRQFPRASGYPEDPATGIAAAALAVSLNMRGWRVPYYRILQGTAMGQPSTILVDHIRIQSDTDGSKVDCEVGVSHHLDSLKGDQYNGQLPTSVAFRLSGKIEVDSRELIEINENF